MEFPIQEQLSYRQLLARRWCSRAKIGNLGTFTAFILFLYFESPGVILFSLALEPKVQQPDTCEVSQAIRNGSSSDVF